MNNTQNINQKSITRNAVIGTLLFFFFMGIFATKLNAQNNDKAPVVFKSCYIPAIKYLKQQEADAARIESINKTQHQLTTMTMIDGKVHYEIGSLSQTEQDKRDVAKSNSQTLVDDKEAQLRSLMAQLGEPGW